MESETVKLSPGEVVSDQHGRVFPEIAADEPEGVSANLSDPDAFNPDTGLGVKPPDDHRLVQGAGEQLQVFRSGKLGACLHLFLYRDLNYKNLARNDRSWVAQDKKE